MLSPLDDSSLSFKHGIIKSSGNFYTVGTLSAFYDPLNLFLPTHTWTALHGYIMSGIAASETCMTLPTASSSMCMAGCFSTYGNFFEIAETFSNVAKTLTIGSYTMSSLLPTTSTLFDFGTCTLSSSSITIYTTPLSDMIIPRTTS
jgi:hypothetical protein